MASQVTCVSIVCSNFCSGADQRKHQSSASMAVLRRIHRWRVGFPHKGPVLLKKSFWWRHQTSICRYHTWVSLSYNRYSLTVMANIFPTESQDGVIVYYDIDGDEGISFRMYEATGDSIGLRLTLVERGQSPDLDGIVIATEGLTLNQWNHVTATYDYNSGEVNLYIDGVTVVTDVRNRCKTEMLSHWLPFVTEGVGRCLSHVVTMRLFNGCYHNWSVSVFFNKLI